MATWNLSETFAHILICNGSSCMKNQGEEVTIAIRQAITEMSLDDHIHTARTRCQGRCKGACTIIVYPEGTWYQQVTSEDAKPLIDAVANNEKLIEKVSHTYCDNRFVRQNDAPIGDFKLKDIEKTRLN